MQFMMGRYDWEHSHYKNLPWAVPVDCCHCGSGKVFTEPPYHPHLPTTWRCADCGGQFGLHHKDGLARQMEGEEDQPPA